MKNNDTSRFNNRACQKRGEGFKSAGHENRFRIGSNSDLTPAKSRCKYHRRKHDGAECALTLRPCIPARCPKLQGWRAELPLEFSIEPIHRLEYPYPEVECDVCGRIAPRRKGLKLVVDEGAQQTFIHVCSERCVKSAKRRIEVGASPAAFLRL